MKAPAANSKQFLTDANGKRTGVVLDWKLTSICAKPGRNWPTSKPMTPCMIARAPKSPPDSVPR